MPSSLCDTVLRGSVLQARVIRAEVHVASKWNAGGSSERKSKELNGT